MGIRLYDRGVAFTRFMAMVTKFEFEYVLKMCGN